MQARLSESQAMIEQLQLKLAQMEKAKAKAAADAADMAQQLDQAQIMNSAMEKKAKQFDRIVGEWKGKVCMYVCINVFQCFIFKIASKCLDYKMAKS